jgi:preprotein translocase subunit Sec61beta
MGYNAAMNPHTAWTQRKREQALRNASACSQAAHDVCERVYITFDGVALVEYSEQVDLGMLRLEPNRIVYAGSRVTRLVPYGSIVLLGAQPMPGAPDLYTCSINSADSLGTMTFLCDSPLEYHIGAWYSRWLEGAHFTEVEPSGTVSLPPTHR